MRYERPYNVTHSIVLTTIRKTCKMANPSLRIPRITMTCAWSGVKQDRHERVIFILMQWNVNLAINSIFNRPSIAGEKRSCSFNGNDIAEMKMIGRKNLVT